MVKVRGVKPPGDSLSLCCDAALLVSHEIWSGFCLAFVCAFITSLCELAQEQCTILLLHRICSENMD